MFQRIKSLRKSEMVKNSFTLLSASTLSQLIAIVVYPIVTRQYSPDELGMLSLFLSIVGVGTILASGKYELAIMIEKEKKDSAAAFDLSFLLNLALCFVMLIVILFFKDWIVNTFHIEPIADYLVYVPLLIFLSALGFVLTYWFNKINRFRLTARYNLVQSSINSGLKVFFGAFGFTQWGLIFANVIGQFVGLLSVFYKKPYFSTLFAFNRKHMHSVAVRQANFPKFTLPHAFINTLAGNLPVLILAAAFNMTEVGLFALGMTMGFKPITVLTGSLNQVFFQKVSINKANGINSFPLIKSFCVKVLLIGLPVFVVLFFLMPSLVTWLFGASWQRAGEYLQCLLPWFFIAIMSSSLSFMPAVAGKQFTAMVLEILYTTLRVLALFIGVWQQDIKLSICLFAGVSAIFVSGLLIWFLYLLKTNK